MTNKTPHPLHFYLTDLAAIVTLIGIIYYFTKRQRKS